MSALRSSSGRPQVGSALRRQTSQSSQAEGMSSRNVGVNESGSTGSAEQNWQSKGKRNTRYRMTEIKRYMCKDIPNAGHVVGSDQKVGCDGVSLGPDRPIPYRQSRLMIHPRHDMSDYPFRNYFVDSSLYDVELHVNASYQRRQHVPLVSLRSKYNGTAIVGHPLSVEVLTDGYCDEIVTNNATTPVSVAEDASAAEMLNSVKQNSETGRISSSSKRAKSRSLSKSSSKMKKNGLLSKKIRKLSSLTGQQEKKPVLEKPKGAVISCIPVKLVFSRLNEAVNGSGRGATGHRG